MKEESGNREWPSLFSASAADFAAENCPPDERPAAWDDERCGESASWFCAFQRRACAVLEGLEDEAAGSGLGGRFVAHRWRRGGGSEAFSGGGGIAAMLREGALFEKAGVHVSRVYGAFSPEFRGRVSGAAEDPRFWASGVSIIVHPRNPHIPAIHMNGRHLVTTRAWYGGGTDLTPHLAFRRRDDDEDALFFHEGLRALCADHACADYEAYRAWCDRYFYLPHRDERRGIGGVFFDDLASGDAAADFAFLRGLGDAFLSLYAALTRRRMGTAWSEAERREQLIRRGRYVEFNLLYDRGTLFGLRTGGNVESILSSLPPLTAWP